MLLINLWFLCEERDFIWFGKIEKKEVVKREYFENIHVYDNPEYGL